MAICANPSRSVSGILRAASPATNSQTLFWVISLEAAFTFRCPEPEGSIQGLFVTFGPNYCEENHNMVLFQFLLSIDKLKNFFFFLKKTFAF